MTVEGDSVACVRAAAAATLRHIAGRGELPIRRREDPDAERNRAQELARAQLVAIDKLFDSGFGS